jgi:hypothetical protein
LKVDRSVQRALLGIGAVLVVGFVAGALVLTRTGSGHGSAVDTTRLNVASTGSVTEPPPPPRGALVLAHEAGERAVALAVERGSRPRLTATVLSSSGGGEPGLRLAFRLGRGAPVLVGHSCGRGCYTARVPPGAALRRVEVLLAGRRIAFRIPKAARPAARIVARATRVFRGLRSLVFVESLRSGPSGGIVTTWSLAAPDRVAYRIHGGASAVVIGRTRWDRDTPDAPWRRSAQLPPLQVPQPAWGDVAVDAHVIGTAHVAGRPVWVVTFTNPTTPAWFTAWIDRRSYRTLQLRMTASSHFMFHRYESFDRPLRIRPPK